MPAQQRAATSQPITAGLRMGARLGLPQHASSCCRRCARCDAGDCNRALGAGSQRDHSKREPAASDAAKAMRNVPLARHGISGATP